MPTISPVSVAAAASIAGFPENELVNAVAVAYSESSWNTGSANACCYGLWQIHEKAHPDAWKRFGLSGDGWKDPQRNANAAFMVWQQSGGWCTRGSPPNCNPWQGYGNSNFKGAIGPATAAVNRMKKILSDNGYTTGSFREAIKVNPTDEKVKMVLDAFKLSGSGLGIDLPNPLGGAAEALEQLHKILQFFTDPHNWIRVGVGMTGLILCFYGLLPYILRGAGKAAAFLPQGKIAKVAMAAKGGKVASIVKAVK